MSCSLLSRVSVLFLALALVSLPALAAHGTMDPDGLQEATPPAQDSSDAHGTLDPDG